MVCRRREIWGQRGQKLRWAIDIDFADLIRPQPPITANNLFENLMNTV